MKNQLSLITSILLICHTASAQKGEIIPNLSKALTASNWQIENREASFEDGIVLDAKPGDGLFYINDFEFTNGKIEVDIKGKDLRGQSFVGIAFHIKNDSTYDAVYFRPFNFKAPDRNTHSVQYISHPGYPWYTLRKNHPEGYESTLSPVPEPSEWFHATIIINYPDVEVFVNNSKKPSLKIEQLSSRKKGWVGFWVGNNSDGSFKNLKITLAD